MSLSLDYENNNNIRYLTETCTGIDPNINLNSVIGTAEVYLWEAEWTAAPFHQNFRKITNFIDNIILGNSTE